MPSKKSNDSPKDSGSKGMNINWMNIVTLLIVVSAIITILLMYLLGNSFVKDDKGYIQKVYTQEIHEYPADPSVDDDKDHKGDDKGITVKNKTMFDETVTLNKNLTCSATTELGTEAVPLAKVYAKEFKLIGSASDDSATDVTGSKVLTKNISLNSNIEIDVSDWTDQDLLKLIITKDSADMNTRTCTANVTLPTEAVDGKVYTALCVTSSENTRCSLIITKDNVITSGDYYNAIQYSRTNFGTYIHQFRKIGSDWLAL